MSQGGMFYPTIKAMSYWHENFDTTNLRINSSSASLMAYQQAVSSNEFVSEAVFINHDIIFKNSLE